MPFVYHYFKIYECQCQSKYRQNSWIALWNRFTVTTAIGLAVDGPVSSNYPVYVLYIGMNKLGEKKKGEIKKKIIPLYEYSTLKDKIFSLNLNGIYHYCGTLKKT